MNSTLEIKSIRNETAKIIIPLLLIPVWLLIYLSLQNITDLIIFDVINLPKDSHLTNAISFFIFEVPKVLLLLLLIVFAVGIIRTCFSPEKTRKILGSKSCLQAMFRQACSE